MALGEDVILNHRDKTNRNLKKMIANKARTLAQNKIICKTDTMGYFSYNLLKWVRIDQWVINRAIR